MARKSLISLLAVTTLFGGVIAVAAEDTDADRAHPKAFVKDSAITTKIKAKLAADHVTSLGRIHVDTDQAGQVELSGTARTQEAIDQAISLAKETKGVKGVHSTITIRKDD